MTQIEEIVAAVTIELRAKLIKHKFSGRIVIYVRPTSEIKQVEVLESVPVSGDLQEILQAKDWQTLHRNPDTQDVSRVERRYLFKNDRLPA